MTLGSITAKPINLYLVLTFTVMLSVYGSLNFSYYILSVHIT